MGSLSGARSGAATTPIRSAPIQLAPALATSPVLTSHATAASTVPACSSTNLGEHPTTTVARAHIDAGFPGRAARRVSHVRILVFVAADPGDLADLDAAIEAGRQAVATTPAGHPDRAGRLSSLESSCLPGSSSPGTWRIWTRRSRPVGRSSTTPPAGHPARAGMLSNLGRGRTRGGLLAAVGTVLAALKGVRERQWPPSAGTGDLPARTSGPGTGDQRTVT
jgi:hypothetical protein